MTFEELNKLVIEWGQQRNIVHNTYPQIFAQLKKVYEELREVEQAVISLEATQEYGATMAAISLKNRYMEELTLELGDLMVTVIMSAACMDLDPVQALEAAYQKIKNRTGKVVDGQFVKDTIQ